MRTSAKYPFAICLGWDPVAGCAGRTGAGRQPAGYRRRFASPAYPTKEIKAGHKGRVMIKVAVDANGKVTSATVHSSSGWRKLDDSALAAVKAGTFGPHAMPKARRWHPRPSCPSRLVSKRPLHPAMCVGRRIGDFPSTRSENA